MSIATEILNQLGGNKFIAMTGSKNFMSDNGGNTLVMTLTANKAKAKHLSITLNSKDTYDMVFGKVVKMQYQEVEKISGVYAEDLQKIFTKVTGLETRI